MKMTVSSFDRMAEENAARLLRGSIRDEIERAIANAKRTAWDKWFRRQWYRATAQIARQQGWRKTGRAHGHLPVGGAEEPRTMSGAQYARR
jgi:hypothetical protein